MEEEVVSNTSIPTYAVLLAVSAIVILALLIVVFFQYRKIQEASRPKFGFLGKPLAIIMIASLALSVYGFDYYSRNNLSEVDQISADTKLELRVDYLQQNQTKYLFAATMLIDGREWGNSNEYAFDIYWTFSNQNISTQIEFDVSRDNPSGITQILAPGRNIVNAKVYYETRVIEKELVINI